jgi:hypothetical protein
LAAKAKPETTTKTKTGPKAKTSSKPNGNTFRARLWRYPGPGGWMFARIPDAYAPPATHAWGRTPVTANIEGRPWATSVWRDRAHGTLLPVPKRLLGGKQAGEVVSVSLRPRDP